MWDQMNGDFQARGAVGQEGNFQALPAVFLDHLRVALEMAAVYLALDRTVIQVIY